MIFRSVNRCYPHRTRHSVMTNPIGGLRTSLGVSMNAFGEALGVSTVSLELWEGDTGVTPQEIETALNALADLKGLQASWLGTLCKSCGHLHPTTAIRVTQIIATCELCGAPIRDFGKAGGPFE